MDELEQLKKNAIKAIDCPQKHVSRVLIYEHGWEYVGDGSELDHEYDQTRASAARATTLM